MITNNWSGLNVVCNAESISRGRIKYLKEVQEVHFCLN